jgi:HEAT repeat protein
VALMLLGKGYLSDERLARTETAKGANGGTGEKKHAADRPGNQGNGKVGEIEPDPPKGNPPANPDPRAAPLDAKIAQLVGDLKSERREERIRAAEGLGKLKEMARPAARALCEVAADAEESVRQAALEALEKVHPALYKHVSTLVLGGDRRQAVQAIKLMGEGANAATPLLLAQLKRDCYPLRFDGEGDILEELASLRAIAPDEASTVAMIVELANYEGGVGQGSRVRAAAAAAIGELAERHPDQRLEMIKAMVRAAQFRPQRSNMVDSYTSVAAINALGKIGPKAKDAVPVLKKLKFSPDVAIREAATAALEKIDPQP